MAMGYIMAVLIVLAMIIELLFPVNWPGIARICFLILYIRTATTMDQGSIRPSKRAARVSLVHSIWS
jgi:hypothetical protein